MKMHMVAEATTPAIISRVLSHFSQKLQLSRRRRGQERNFGALIIAKIEGENSLAAGGCNETPRFQDDRGGSDDVPEFAIHRDGAVGHPRSNLHGFERR